MLFAYVAEAIGAAHDDFTLAAFYLADLSRLFDHASLLLRYLDKAHRQKMTARMVKTSGFMATLQPVHQFIKALNLSSQQIYAGFFESLSAKARIFVLNVAG